MDGASEGPGKQPEGDQHGDHASHQHEGAAEIEQVSAGDNEGDDDDAEAAGNHDRGADRGNENRDGMVSAVAGTRIRFSVHGRPNSGDVVASTRGLMVRDATFGRSSPMRKVVGVLEECASRDEAKIPQDLGMSRRTLREAPTISTPLEPTNWSRFIVM